MLLVFNSSAIFEKTINLYFNDFGVNSVSMVLRHSHGLARALTMHSSLYTCLL